MSRECIILKILVLIIFTKYSNAVNTKTGLENLSHDIGHEKKYMIYKCCPFGNYVGKKKTCVRYNGTLTFSEIEVCNKSMQKTGKSVKDLFTILPGRFEDKNFSDRVVVSSIIEEHLGFNSYFNEDGTLTLELPNTYNRWWHLPKEDFCVDYRMLHKVKTVSYWAIMPGEENEKSNQLYSCALLVSCFFMLLVLIVYFMLPELQNLCGLILMAYVASLLLAFLLLAIIQISRYAEKVCIGLTLGIYYFFIASFCWMSIMSYDIWWTFRGYAKARPIHRRGERFKFLMYCLYAWGLPLGMTIAVGVLNEVNMRHLPWFITPHIPKLGCFIEGGIKFLYLYVPMLVLILCNWIFYLMTAFNIWRLSRGTAVLDSAAAGNPQAHRTHRHRFMVYLKLSVVMGLNWLLEIVSFLYPDLKMWYISDAYNILIGLSIFLIFVCKKKIYRKLYKRYLGGNRTRRWNPSSKSNSSSTTDSSQETATLQSKVLTNPKGMNGYAMAHVTNRLD